MRVGIDVRRVFLAKTSVKRIIAATHTLRNMAADRLILIDKNRNKVKRLEVDQVYWLSRDRSKMVKPLESLKEDERTPLLSSQAY